MTAQPRRWGVSFLGALILALSGSLFIAAPADALSGSSLIGHRCRTYDRAVTNENTVVALQDTAAGAPGAYCEIDVYRISDGTFIVWHDPTWSRVANHATLPKEIAPTDRVVNATREQIAGIKTKGGAPVA